MKKGIQCVTGPCSWMFGACRSVCGKALKKKEKSTWRAKHRLGEGAEKADHCFQRHLICRKLSCISNRCICVLLISCLHFRRLSSGNRGKHICLPHHATAAVQFRCDTWIASSQFWHASLSAHTCMHVCPVVIRWRGIRENETLSLHPTENLI